MRSATVVLLLVAVLFTSTASAEMIRVVPINVNDNTFFKCGDRCKFRGSLPNEPLRVRIIRGSMSGLTAMANDPRYTAAGCIELYSTVVRPRRSRRASDLLDLKFYFNQGWLASGGGNGQFVFIVERDDAPKRPRIERTSMLRLPAGRQGAAYFLAGAEVEVHAPVHVTRSGGGFLARFFGAIFPAPAAVIANGRAGEMAMAMPEEETILADAALPEPMPRATSAANCVDLEIDPQSVIIRRADAPPRKGPVRVAVK